MKKWNFKKDPFVQRETAKYENPVPSREMILDYITKKSSQSRKQLIAVFGLSTEEELEAFRRRLKAMVRDGQLIKSRQGKFNLSTRGDVVQGTVIGHRDGFGFVAPEDGTSDIFLSARQMRQVLHGDKVLVRVVNVDYQNRREGMIDKIVERKIKEVVGRFFIEREMGFVDPDNKRINQDIMIPLENTANAKPGQIVNVEIVTFPTEHAQGIGRVVEVLGDYMAPGMEVEVAVRAFDLPHQWPEKVLQEVSRFSSEVTKADKKDRIDLRELPLVTIDGEDAKDFDDAVYCEPRKQGGWRLVVAIADVSHYVKPNTALDHEACERGNSVYFTGKVIPMLPHVLSNGLCSLNPKVDRLCMVCDMNISPEGEVCRARFYSAVMRSHARLTYKIVAKLLKGGNPRLKQQHADLFPHLENLHELYQTLDLLRQKRGALHFERPEYKVEFGKGRKIKCFYPEERNVAHKIIEECMICANISAAKFISKHHGAGLFRVHDGPKSEKWRDLKIFLGELGIKVTGGDLPVSMDYAKIIDQVAGRPDEHFIHTILLRSLAQAVYLPDDDGHFALAFESYTHFTSPIRRYPDLIVHRAICAILEKRSQKTQPTHEALQVLGEHCSMTERRADEATRDALNWLKCEFMLDKVGQEFQGVISSVTGFGVFVELCDSHVEGLIPIHQLKGDHYHFDPVRHRLMGKNTGKMYRIGDLLQVRVDRVDLENKQIDFSLINSRKKKSKK